MSRGGPDDGILASTVSGTAQNPAIDTARGAGFSLLDNLGRLVFYSNFADGLGGWGFLNTGNKPAIKVRRDNLSFPTAGLSPYGPNPAYIAGHASLPSGMYQTMHVPPSGKVGLEVGLRTDSNSTLGSWFDIALTHNVGSVAYSMRVRYSPSSQVFQYYNQSFVWTNFPTGAFLRGANGYDWWAFKVVGDFTSAKITRLLLPNGTALPNVDMPSATAERGELNLALVVPNNGGTLTNEYIGYVAVTQDEP